ncbi:hypothetical protein [Azospirillum brasilense]|uniref:hypothetical protein n=1 Tax=Azospirillum brasilense TaxID=192 RepID=UPI000E0AD770|nr:hypothetical protein [Azospirillum brasilense]
MTLTQGMLPAINAEIDRRMGEIEQQRREAAAKLVERAAAWKEAVPRDNAIVAGIWSDMKALNAKCVNDSIAAFEEIMAPLATTRHQRRLLASKLKKARQQMEAAARRIFMPRDAGQIEFEIQRYMSMEDSFAGFILEALEG